MLRSTSFCDAMCTLVPVAVSMLGRIFGCSPHTSMKASAGQAVTADPVSSKSQYPASDLGAKLVEVAVEAAADKAHTS